MMVKILGTKAKKIRKNTEKDLTESRLKQNRGEREREKERYLYEFDAFSFQSSRVIRFSPCVLTAFCFKLICFRSIRKQLPHVILSAK